MNLEELEIESGIIVFLEKSILTKQNFQLIDKNRHDLLPIIFIFRILYYTNQL